MKEIKTKVGIFHSEIDLSFKIVETEMTLEDFDGSQVRYDNYLEGRRSIIEYEKRMNTEKNLQNVSELDEASNGSMGAMPGKTYTPPKRNKAIAKINAITKR